MSAAPFVLRAPRTTTIAVLFAGLLGACQAPAGDRTVLRDSSPGIVGRDRVPSAPPMPDTADIFVEVELAARQVRVIGPSGDTLAQHAVAVGSPEWPTRTGRWAIEQVVLNPEWVPPDETWAEEREPKAPGEPDNPLGAAQLVYDLPRTIHGTNDPSSIGKAVSHGSIRVTNTDALALARLMMRQTGIGDADERLARAAAERQVKQVIDLPKVVPIRVY